MFQFIIKSLLTGIIAASISLLAKRSSLLAAAIASLPLTSILALIWLYTDTQNVKDAVDLSTNIFWMVLPSLFFFLAFPFLIKTGMRFYPALILSCLLMSGVYWGYVQILKKFGVSL